MFFEYSKKKKPLEEYSWVKDDQIYVDHIEWAEIKSNYERKEIVAHLRKVIVELQPPTPFHEYSQIELDTEFRKLSTTKYIPKKEEWNTDRVEDISLLFKGEYVFFKNQNPTGKKVSNTHTQRIRAVAWYTARPASYAKAWDRLRNGELDVLPINIVHFADKCLDNKALMSGARLSGCLVNQFKPSVAKGVYDFFDAKRVLDFSAGWGDRLVGFLASNAESYIGIDPNTKLHDPYRQIVEDNNHSNKETDFICLPAEQVEYSKLKYDFVFTSPPYFNLEVYTDESTQSATKDTKLEDWLKDFLFETINRVYEGLVNGGRIAINICDHRFFKVCNTLIKHMESLGATYEGVVGFEIASRPLNAKGSVSRGIQERRGEPIFIWSKGKASEPKWYQDYFFGG